MAKYFTVHSPGKHHEGAVLNLKPVASNLPATTEAEFREAAEFLFPRGVSDQGLQYFLRPWSMEAPDPALMQTARDAFSEFLLEMIRRDFAPDAPSRFESWFGFSDLDDARWFKATFRQNQGEIFEVEHDRGFRGDFGLVASLAGTPLRAATYGHRYWSGEPHWHQPPRWEILLPAPVAIGARIEEPARP